ncbi:MAG TPA: hypothetical protein VGM27_01355 [Acidobacteriaceae bacterium]|jgi:hypothetical protein
MTDKSLPLAAAVVAAALLGAQAQAQATPANSSGQVKKPSPYQGVATPPASDVISTSEEPAPQAPAAPVKITPPANSVSSPTLSTTSVAPSADLSAGANDAPTHVKTASAGAVDPDAGIVTYVPGPANALPEGTVFRARMLQNVMAAETTPGTPFRAKLSHDLVYNGRIVVPMGSELRGKIVHTSHGRRISGTSVIHLRPDEFVLPDGTSYHLHAMVIDTQGSDTKATGEGNIAQKSHGKRALAEVAIGGGGGALVGAAVGGPTGAAVGSVVGAGAMGAHLLLANQSVDLPEGSTVVFSLTDPMFLTPTRD